MENPTKFVSHPTMTILSRNRRTAPVHVDRTVSKRAVALAARGGGGDYVGRSVDEGMIILRRRLREMKAAEMGGAWPSDWMEWERRYYDHYVEDVCGAVGLLQCCLMNLRPSLGIGMVALVALSVPFSTGTVFCMIVAMFSPR